MRVLICGSRNWKWKDLKPIQSLIDSLPEDTLIIEGEAPGVDLIAATLASNRGMKVLPFPAEWEKYGKAAGPIRNKQMLEEGKPDIVHAFSKDLPRSKGTRNMISQARNAKIEVIIHN